MNNPKYIINTKNTSSYRLFISILLLFSHNYSNAVLIINNNIDFIDLIVNTPVLSNIIKYKLLNIHKNLNGDRD